MALPIPGGCKSDDCSMYFTVVPTMTNVPIGKELSLAMTGVLNPLTLLQIAASAHYLKGCRETIQNFMLDFDIALIRVYTRLHQGNKRPWYCTAKVLSG